MFPLKTYAMRLYTGFLESHTGMHVKRNRSNLPKLACLCCLKYDTNRKKRTAELNCDCCIMYWCQVLFLNSNVYSLFFFFTFWGHYLPLLWQAWIISLQKQKKTYPHWKLIGLLNKNCPTRMLYFTVCVTGTSWTDTKTWHFTQTWPLSLSLALSALLTCSYLLTRSWDILFILWPSASCCGWLLELSGDLRCVFQAWFSSPRLSQSVCHWN